MTPMEILNTEKYCFFSRHVSQRLLPPHILPRFLYFRPSFFSVICSRSWSDSFCQSVFFLIVVLSIMLIVEQSFIGLITPLFDAQMLNALICRQAISELYVSQRQNPAFTFPNQNALEDRLRTNRTFCGIESLPSPPNPYKQQTTYFCHKCPRYVQVYSLILVETFASLSQGIGGNCCGDLYGSDALSRVAFEGLASNIPSNFEGFSRIQTLILYKAYIELFKHFWVFVKEIGNIYFVQKFQGGLRRKVLDSFMVQDMGFFDARPPGVLLSRVMNDINEVQGVAVVFSMLFSTVWNIALSANVAFDLNPSLMILFLSLIPIELMITAKKGNIERKLTQAMNNRMGKHYQVMTEILDKVKHIKVFNGINAALQQFSNSLQLNYRIEAFMFYLTNFGFDLILSLYQNVFQFSLMYISARMMLPRLRSKPYGSVDPPFPGSLSYGEYSVFLQYATLVKERLTMVYSMYQSVTKVFVMAQTMCYFLYRKPVGGGEKMQGAGIVGAMDSIDTTIRFENVSFAYPSRPGVPVLKHFSCSFPAKKFSCIIGNSGGGKSTTMSLILRMYEPSSGTLWLGNHEFNTVNLTFLRECFAYVTQQPVMFSQTIRENLLCELPFPLCLFVTSCADTPTLKPPPNNSPLPSRMRAALASSILSLTAWRPSSLVCPVASQRQRLWLLLAFCLWLLLAFCFWLLLAPCL